MSFSSFRFEEQFLVIEFLAGNPPFSTLDVPLPLTFIVSGRSQLFVMFFSVCDEIFVVVFCFQVFLSVLERFEYYVFRCGLLCIYLFLSFVELFGQEDELFSFLSVWGSFRRLFLKYFGHFSSSPITRVDELNVVSQPSELCPFSFDFFSLCSLD